MLKIFKKKLLLLFLLLLFLAIFLIIYFMQGCQTMKSEDSFTEESIKDVIRDIKPLELSKPPVYTEAILNYFKHYKIDFEYADHYFGTFKSAQNKIAAHIFLPDRAKATIFLIHGYMDHTGTLNRIIGNLLENGYAVSAFDLPGHGLSHGERGDIKDFEDYAVVINDFKRYCENLLPLPWHIIGHSTGCSAIIEYMYNYKDEDRPFSTYILAAPLVRSTSWNISKIGHLLLKGVIKKVPRINKKISSDKEYLEFARNHNPLRLKRVPITWIDSLFEWNKKLSEYKPCVTQIIVIQGNKDSVVDWKYNIPVLREKFTNMKLHIIKNARHDLFNEITEIRQEVFSTINMHVKGL